MVNKDFITYEEALGLKDLDFNEPCFAYYYNSGTSGEPENKNIIGLGVGKPSEIESYMRTNISICKAPTYQQVFRWFRTEYALAGLPEIGSQEFSYRIYNTKTDKLVTSDINYNGTYEEAESKCLERLIKIARTTEKISTLNMKKISCTPTNSTEIYSENFSLKGFFIIDSIEIRENNPTSDKKLVAVIKAHHREQPDFKVEATSDKFLFN